MRPGTYRLGIGMEWPRPSHAEQRHMPTQLSSAVAFIRPVDFLTIWQGEDLEVATGDSFLAGLPVAYVSAYHSLSRRQILFCYHETSQVGASEKGMSQWKRMYMVLYCSSGYSAL